MSQIAKSGDLLPDGSPPPALELAENYLGMPEAMTFEQARYAMGFVGELENRSRWYYGDLVIQVERQWPHEWQQLIDVSPGRWQTMMRYRRVCRRFPRAQRRPVSFSHHHEVVAMSDRDAYRWLDLAAEGGWGKDRMRDEILDFRRRKGLREEPAQALTFAKEFRVQSKRLRASANGAPCMLRVPGVCRDQRDTTVLCHQPTGSGMGMKSDDLAASFGCVLCHDWVDARGRITASRDERMSAWLEGVVRTHAWWAERGYLAVKGFGDDG